MLIYFEYLSKGHLWYGIKLNNTKRFNLNKLSDSKLISLLITSGINKLKILSANKCGHTCRENHLLELPQFDAPYNL